MRNPDCIKYNDCLTLAGKFKKPLECDDCKGLIVKKTGITEENDPDIKINHKGNKEINMTEKNEGKKCEIPGCPNDAFTRGLCKKVHYGAWRLGRISHPRFGAFKVRQKHEKEGPGPVKKPVKKTLLPERPGLANSLLDLLRVCLTDARSLAAVLKIMGHEDLARTEISAQLKDYIDAE